MKTAIVLLYIVGRCTWRAISRWDGRRIYDLKLMTSALLSPGMSSTVGVSMCAPSVKPDIL